MMIAGGALANVNIGSLMPISTADGWPGHPIDIVINGACHRYYTRPDSLRITDTLGQPVVAQFMLVNPAAAPELGSLVRILWYDLVIFAGLIIRVAKKTNNTNTANYYDCECNDYTHLLTRKKIARNFSEISIYGLADSLIDEELANDGFAIGTTDAGPNIPLVDSDDARALDVLSESAAAIGMTFFVGFDKTLNFISTTSPSFPVALSVTNTETAQHVTDFDGYRNKQVVIATGTPADSSTDALEVSHTRTNSDQIAARQAIEGGSGIVEEREKIKHPTSNLQADLQLLAIAYARLRLSAYGTPRRTVRARTRSYGFRAGQVGQITLTALGVTGEWLIQRVSIMEQSGRKLIFEIEAVLSSTQWRSYIAWLNIVRSGKVTVLPPTALTNNLETFNTPGATTWTVPVGVTVAEFTCIGGSAGGSGGLYYYGGRGGHSGLAVTSRDVIPGEVYDLRVGAKGNAGVSQAFPPGPTAGTAGTVSDVKLGAVVICQGDPGLAGTVGSGSGPGADGGDGSGIGDAVTVGGGVTGGAGGTWTASTGYIQPADGSDGRIEVRY